MRGSLERVAFFSSSSLTPNGSELVAHHLADHVVVLAHASGEGDHVAATHLVRVGSCRCS